MNENVKRKWKQWQSCSYVDLDGLNEKEAIEIIKESFAERKNLHPNGKNFKLFLDDLDYGGTSERYFVAWEEKENDEEFVISKQRLADIKEREEKEYLRLKNKFEKD